MTKLIQNKKPRFKIDQFIRQGYRIYEPPEGFRLTSMKQNYFYDVHGLIVEFDETFQIIKVRNAR